MRRQASRVLSVQPQAIAAKPPVAQRRKAPGQWQIPDSPDVKQVAKLAGELRVSPLCARILLHRGFSAPQACSDFIARRMDLMHDPRLLPDIEKAVARIAAAVEKKEKIVLFGDYDVDGVSATALLARFFRLLRVLPPQLEALVPERHDGYGLSAHALKTILDKKPALLITLDNGISACAAVDTLNAAGIDSIIVDHHHVGEALPAAVAVINPKRGDSRYPYKELCGAGLAFKLAWALSVHFSHDKKVTPEFRAFLMDSLALAGAGTLADVVPLEGENRLIAHYGLVALAKTRMPGLRALMTQSDIAGVPRAHEIAFRLAPRINAAGRCGLAAEALELLLTENEQKAAELAALLDGYNSTRQEIENRILLEARQQAQRVLLETPACRALVLHSPDWHLGVIGIVASRIVEEFYRPVLLIKVDAERKVAQGSGRSIRGLHLSEALSASCKLLVSYGGHAAAAGFTLEESRIAEFSSAFESTAASTLRPEDLIPRLGIDALATTSEMTLAFCRELEAFEPCGAGNPRPRLAILKAGLAAPPRLMGREEQHLQFFVEGKPGLRTIAFHHGERFNEICDLGQNGGLDIAFHPQINYFRGEHSVELVLESFRKSASSPA